MPNGSGGSADTCEDRHRKASRPRPGGLIFCGAGFCGGANFCGASLLCCKTYGLQNFCVEDNQASSRANGASCTRQAALTRVGATVDSVGNGLGIAGETLNQFDNFGSLLGRKFHEGSKQSQTFDCFVRWRSKLRSQIRNKRATFHLAPLTVDQVESMPRNNSAGKIDRSAEKLFSSEYALVSNISNYGDVFFEHLRLTAGRRSQTNSIN